MDESKTNAAGYPDAVALVPDPSVPELLARIGTSVGRSIKDSFASLDLTGYGFRVLFDAQWMVRMSTAIPPRPASPRWGVVYDRDGLVAWEQAWRSSDGPPGVFRTELLDPSAVACQPAPRR
jgi:hypothetical protein